MMLKADWQRYNELIRKDKSEMTAEEWNLYKDMYRLEEFQAGLDGDYNDED